MVINEEEEDEYVIKPSMLSSESMVSVTVGRVMSTLLAARPKKLQDAISSLHSAASQIAPLHVSLEQSLWFLHKYIKDAAEKGYPLDDVLIPMIEHSLKIKESRHSNQAIILLNWLFQDELLFQALATNFAGILSRKHDHYIVLGWCTLARCLIEYDIIIDKLLINGIREKHNALLKIFSSCLTPLLSIVCSGSTLQGEFELPTRLAMAAADFILSHTVALAKIDPISHFSDKKPKSFQSTAPNMSAILASAAITDKRAKSACKLSEQLDDTEMKFLLWEHLDEVIILVQRLINWSRKSRSLHVKGLERVLTWLKETKQHYMCFQNEAGSGLIKTAAILLASCWKHYGKLLHLEQYKFSQHSKELLDQYLAGIQFYADNCIGEKSENKDSGTETIKFFLNCLSLLLGRLDSKQFDRVRTEFGPQLSQILISQLRSIDADVVGDAVCILKAVIFKTTNPRCRGSVFDTSEMRTILPLLFNFFDERDAAARAVATLVGEYCFISSDSRCLQDVLKHLTSENSLQRMNALDVISVLSNIALDSGMILEQTIWKDIANNLLQRLGDEELEIQSHASKLITRIDPSLVLPTLVHLVSLSDEKMQSTASETLIAMLKYHNQKCEVICMLIDCLSNLCQGVDPPEAADDGRKGQIMDADRVLKLIPEWSKTVGDWNSMIGPLIDKLFLEPSNATIVKFLSSICEYLAETVDVVFRQLLIHTKRQKVIDISFSKWETGSCSNDDAVKLQNSLFARLCPLLIIRLLPLKVFNDLDSSLMYGELSSQCSIRGTGYFDLDDTRCVAALLLNRAFNTIEFEDVRKLAAELCGRIHPHVLFPIICSQLEHATSDRNVLKIKACLFSICTSLVVRGWNSILYPHILKIRTAIESILLWPSTVGDEVSKAQHGCIDCLALMICMELQAPKSLKGSTCDPTSTVANNGDTSGRNLVLTYVIYQLTRDQKILVSHTLVRGECMKQEIAPLQFRLCMANVLISACQKISDSGKKIFARKVLPCVTSSVEVIEEPEIRAACVQVLFSAVYHLKSAVLPYTSVLLKVSIKSLEKDTQKERMSGAKLLASLMASVEEVVENISGGLLEARSLLSTLSVSDPSSEMQQICQRLLMCLTSS